MTSSWDKRLPKPDPLGGPDIYPCDVAHFNEAFRATEAWQYRDTANVVDTAEPAQRARRHANLATPDGYLFAYHVDRFTPITITTLQPNEARRLTVHRDKITIPAGWVGRWVLGDRLYFSHDLPGRDDLNLARLNVVDPHRKSPRYPIAVGISQLGLAQKIRDNELLMVTELSAAKDNGAFIHPRGITALAYGQLDLLPLPEAYPVAPTAPQADAA